MFIRNRKKLFQLHEVILINIIDELKERFCY